MDPIRRNILATSAAASALAAAPRVFAQQSGQGGATTSFYEKGNIPSVTRRSVLAFHCWSPREEA